MLAAALVSLAACGGNPPREPARADSAAPAVAAPEAAAQAAGAPAGRAAPAVPAAARKLTVGAVGDMMLGTDYPENRLPDDDGVYFLDDVAAILREPDITFGNLEGVLQDGGEAAKECANPRNCYLFRSPARYVQHFVEAGFDVLSLANNHARDFGEDGRSATMRTLDEAGLYHSGRRGDFASFEANGLRIAVLAFAVTRNSNLLHDYDGAAATVARFAADHDIVIVSFHGGAEGLDVTRLPFAEEEYFGEPRGDVVRFARLMVDSGADLVLGHGPHVVRAMERYRDRLIAYSLGNFATYYGISVAGLNGIAPILVTTLAGDGRFVEARIFSTIQVRPGGPRPDGREQALQWLRDLSMQDFRDPGLEFLDDGRVLPAPRGYLRPWPVATAPTAGAADQASVRQAARSPVPPARY